MIEVQNIRIPIDFLESKEDEILKIKDFLNKKLKINFNSQVNLIFKKRSIDARNKNKIFIVYNILIIFSDNEKLNSLIKFLNNSINKKLDENSFILETEYGKISIKNLYQHFIKTENFQFFNHFNNINSTNFEKINNLLNSKEFFYYLNFNKISLKNLISELINFIQKNKFNKNNIINPLIIGSGPAGLFCALVLSYGGIKVTVIERGDSVEIRNKKIENLTNNRILDEDSNIQFGEGGAGTYSDGKLTTNLNNNLIKILFDTLVQFGADEEILYSSTPHIGTDLLKNIVINIRKEIEKNGGKIYFNKRVTNLKINKNNFILTLKDTRNNLLQKDYQENIESDLIIFATGNGAYDVMELLINIGVSTKPKPFSIGLRIEHPRDLIEESLFGKYKKHKLIGSATYKLASHFYDNRNKRKRGVYTFCMCPGGYVIPSITENKTIVINGMSYHKRDGENSNSAILVDIYPEDYNIKNSLESINFRKEIEKLAFSKTFNIDKLEFNAPGIYLKDFLDGSLCLKNSFYKNYSLNKTDKIDKIDKINKRKNLSQTIPTYKPGITYTDFNNILPDDIIYFLKKGIKDFGTKFENFDYEYAFLTGVETRSSSPIWVLRDKYFNTNIKNLYAIGECSGYSGGIVSSALEGINLALKILTEVYL